MKDINDRMEANGVIWQPCQICRRTWPWPVGYKVADEYICPICYEAGEAQHSRKVMAAIKTMPENEDKATIARICRELSCPCFCGMHISSLF